MEQTLEFVNLGRRKEDELTNAFGQDAINLIRVGASKAIAGLSTMVGKQIEITNVAMNKMKVNKVPDLFGGPEALMVAVYLQASGYGEGHLIVGYDPDIAFKLIGEMLGGVPQSMQNLSAMEESVLGEIGNIMGSFFLSVLADNSGIRILPSPPAVMMDMAGAILDVPLASMLKNGEYTYVMAVTFGTLDGQIDGKFLVVPVPEIKMACG